MIDFFEQQDGARRDTLLLVMLFSIAVFLIVIVTNLFVVVVWWSADTFLLGNIEAYLPFTSAFRNRDGAGIFSYISWKRFFSVGVIVVLGIIISGLFKWFKLRAGGKIIAESLSGKRLAPNTRDSKERRLINVVEEMAIASGMPTPPVYLLSREIGINAFAAGQTPADAVIGVTQGTMDHLNRDQLQGVIAHEFSHILNGDMRLNIRLIAVLDGILFIGQTGQMLLRSLGPNRYIRGTARRNIGIRSAIDTLGIGLVLVGWVGTLLGSLIKAAVCRKREFLADASAVQFTRNRQGISEALKIMGGYRGGMQVRHPYSGEVSHLFFGQAVDRMQSLFATHPSLEARILRIEPGWDGRFIRWKTANQTTGTQGRKPSLLTKRPQGAVAVAGAVMHAAMAQAFETIPQELDAVPMALRDQAHDPSGARAVVLALLFDKNVDIRVTQWLKVEDQAPDLLPLIRHLLPDVCKLSEDLHLPLLQITLPALKCLSAQQYDEFKPVMMALIMADHRIDLFEWALYQLVSHYLDTEFKGKRPSRNKYKRPHSIASEYQLVLSMLAHHGNQDTDQKKRAFSLGATTAGLYTLDLLPEDECRMDAFSDAVEKLADAYPLLQHRLLKGLAGCAGFDKRIKPVEHELVTAIAAIMDCPIPRLNIDAR